eukprot:gnl/TRDRNA2_/TRDRNA2_184333_c0_seq1.p1 gnl/TRDRNA2_/TRDRNA2_184333_c0~~gnl/TRDRNA2_/TRDRNA2_184333_c0_seq1.p1  ORF type:complete len:264 (+),score=30.65 gnl/TRDRNA2_/TRDRNA2_184333_c0_seq1:64-792(+)
MTHQEHKMTSDLLEMKINERHDKDRLRRSVSEPMMHKGTQKLADGTTKIPRYRPRRGPAPSPPGEAWKKGWIAHPAISSGPRWTQGKEGVQTSVDRSYNTHSKEGFSEKRPFIEKNPRCRNTWIQKHMRQWSWTPGPGSYKTEREFLFKADDEVDTNKTIQEAAPDYSFGNEKKETIMKLKDVKMRRNNHCYPKQDPWFTPGPGSYMQYSTFGCPSGGSRKAYFGGVPEHNWNNIETRRSER